MKALSEQIREISQETIVLRGLSLWQGFCFFSFHSTFYIIHQKKIYKTQTALRKTLHRPGVNRSFTASNIREKIDIKIVVKFIAHA